MRQIFYPSLGGHYNILPYTGKLLLNRSQLPVYSNNHGLALTNLVYIEVGDNTRNDYPCELHLVLVLGCGCLITGFRALFSSVSLWPAKRLKVGAFLGSYFEPRMLMNTGCHTRSVRI